MMIIKKIHLVAAPSPEELVGAVNNIIVNLGNEGKSVIQIVMGLQAKTSAVAGIGKVESIAYMYEGKESK